MLSPWLRQSCTDASIIINDVTTTLTAEPEQQTSFLAGCSLLTSCPESGRISVLLSELIFELKKSDCLASYLLLYYNYSSEVHSTQYQCVPVT